MIEVVIPKLGMTMKDGTIVEWAVPHGARVDSDDVVLVLSTDKLETDVTAEGSGTLHHVAKAGDTLPVSTVVGWILGDGETAPHADNGTAATPAGRVVASPYARRLAVERGIDLRDLHGTGPGGRIVAADVPTGPSPAAPPVGAELPPIGTEPPPATPVARRIAERDGVDLAAVTGTGPGGRITKEDVEAAAAAPPTSALGAAPPPAPGTTIPMRGMRKVIAERMHASLRDMAQLTLGAEVDMTAAVALRRQLVEAWEPDGVRVSVTDLVCCAAVKALESHPLLNASVGADGIHLHPQVDLGLAVAVPDGLLVPVVRSADQRTLAGLSAEASRLADACRVGTVDLADLEGATFTVSALGASGIDFFTPVINPPNVAILGVGRLHDGVAWHDDRPVRRDVLTLSLTIDHRAVDGAPAANFLATVRSLLDDPYRLLT